MKLDPSISEANELEVIKRAIKPWDIVVEGGGGSGLLTHELMRLAKRVIVYEPEIEWHERLLLSGAIVHSHAIAGTEGARRFYRREWRMNSSLDEEDPNAPGSNVVGWRTVACDPLNQVIERWHPTALVLDIEGAEYEALLSSRLPGVQRLVIELHKPGMVDELLTHLASLGFHLQNDLEWQYDRVAVGHWEQS